MSSSDQQIGRILGDRKRRNQKPRVLQSCTACRKRKVKCDRKLPCDNCSQARPTLFCHYTPERQARSFGHETHINKNNSHAEWNGYDIADSTTKKAKPTGLLLSGPTGTRYMTSGHWQAIMNATRQLKQGNNHTFDEQSQADAEKTSHGPYLLQGIAMKMNIVDLLAALPDRSTTEKLVSDYFDSQEPSLIFIHGPTFRNECDEFWQAPTKVSPAWLAILYGIISCAQWIDHIINVDSPVTKPDGFKPFDLFDLYRKQCALCLANSNYTHPGKYKVEALGLYLGLEYLHSNNLKTSVSVLLAIAIRLATLMGYHRDAKPYSQVTVFDAEMRRRVWLFLQVTDSVVAWQTGVPRIISQKIGDTAFPTNLLDDDFGPTDTKLPPPRPNTHLTSGVIYLIAREHIMSASSDITDKMSMKTLSHEETTHLNQQLEQARDKVPPFLRITNPNTNQDLNLHRYTLEITFQRTRCILHRQYLVTHRNEQKYKPLHQICVDSARQILHHQSNLFQGIVHQARLYSRTCFSASLSISDCLTAAMVICFEIICLSREHPADSSRADLIRLLQNSCETWRCFPKASFETSKAAETIASMLALVHLDDSHGAVEFPVSVQRGGAELRSPVSMTGDTGTGAFLNVLNGDSTLEMFDWGLWDREMMEMNCIIANHVPF